MLKNMLMNILKSQPFNSTKKAEKAENRIDTIFVMDAKRKVEKLKGSL